MTDKVIKHIKLKDNEVYKISGSDENALTKNQITNCLLEVPQNIKLELNNGTLTLKSGSKVIVPNGAGVFDELILDTNYTATGITLAGTGKLVVFYHKIKNRIMARYPNKITSGTTAPTTTYSAWYDTASNQVYDIEDDTSVRTNILSFPIAIVTVNSEKVITSIDQVFNGFGYIGSTIWADKGVKILCANGWNDNGSYKNIEGYIDKVQTLTTTNTGAKTLGMYFDSNGKFAGWSQGVYKNSIKRLVDRPTNWTGGYWTYVEDENKVYVNQNTESSNVVMFAEMTVTSTSITKLDVDTTFRANNYDNTVLKSSLRQAYVVTEIYQNGTSWYRIYSDGWCEQGGVVSTAASVTFLKPYKDTYYTLVASGVTTSANSTQYRQVMPNSKTATGFTGTSNSGVALYWVAYGYMK